MAHRGWAGNGFSVDTWWRSAELYEIDPLDFQDSDGDGFGDLAGLTSRLDYLQTLGVDGLVLSPFRLETAPRQGAASVPEGVAWQPTYGNDEDFDRLAQEASRRHLRLVVDLAFDGSQSAEQTLAAARFWLSRGVSGLRLHRQQNAAALSSEEAANRTRSLRHLCASYAGDRVLIAEPGSADAAAKQAFAVRGRVKATTFAAQPGGAQIALDETLAGLTQWTPDAVRQALEAQGSGEGLRLAISDGAQRVRTPERLSDAQDASTRGPVARQLAVALLAGREWPLLYFGQELGMASAPGEPAPAPMQWGGVTGFSSARPWVAMGPNAATANVASEESDPDSLLNWYRKLGALRHSQAALGSGSLTLLATSYPNIVAWVRRGTGEHAHATPVLVVLNVSAQSAVLSMRDSLHGAGLEASSGLRPLAVAPAGQQPSFTAGAITLGPYGIYMGELRQAGLEASAVSSPHGRHRGR